MLFILVFIAALAASFIESKSQCDPGMIRVQPIIQYNDNCSFLFDLCIDCGTSAGMLEGKLRIREIYPLPPSGECLQLKWDGIDDWVYQQAIQFYIEYCNIDDPPPCGESDQYLEMWFPLCYKWRHMEWNMGGFTEWHTYQVPCPNGWFCYEKHEICTNEDGNIDVNTIIQTVTDHYGTCPWQEPDTTGMPDDEFWESSCWREYQDCSDVPIFLPYIEE